MRSGLHRKLLLHPARRSPTDSYTFREKSQVSLKRQAWCAAQVPAFPPLPFLALRAVAQQRVGGAKTTLPICRDTSSFLRVGLVRQLQEPTAEDWKGLAGAPSPMLSACLAKRGRQSPKSFQDSHSHGIEPPGASCLIGVSIRSKTIIANSLAYYLILKGGANPPFSVVQAKMNLNSNFRASSGPISDKSAMSCTITGKYRQPCGK